MEEGSISISERGLFRPDGKPIFSTPTPEQISQINSLPQAEYFSTLAEDPEVVARFLKYAGIYRVPGIMYQFNQTAYKYHRKYVLNPLLEKISSEFGTSPQDIVIRGTAGSIDRPVDTKTYGRLMTLEQMLKAGSDTGKQETRVASLAEKIDPKLVEEAVTTYGRGHADAYLQSWSAILRNDLLSSEDAKSIFPILFIYDAKMLKRSNHDQLLPDEPELREKAIIKAYVLDHLHEENARKVKTT